MDDLLPVEITWRKDKIGFEPPQKEWMQADAMKNYVMEARKKIAAAGIIQKEIVDKKYSRWIPMRLIILTGVTW